jgi:methylmalonyl-CoA mutase
VNLHVPQHPIRFVTAASLFDGHDAAINVMRRILQSQGAEVIHLGHDRSVAEIVQAAIQEDVQGVAVSSYQGGHVEYFSYLRELLDEAGADHVRVYGGGGGVIVPSEIELLAGRGVKIFSPEDGQRMGLPGMINTMIAECDVDLPGGRAANGEKLELVAGDQRALAQKITAIETSDWRTPANEPTRPDPVRASESAVGPQHVGDPAGNLNGPPTERKASDEGIAADSASDRGVDLAQGEVKSASSHRSFVVGITGTGGSGKSSLTDELLRRFRLDYEDKLRIAVVAVDPTRRRGGGALLGDRIRMNSLDSDSIYFRSMATRGSSSEIPDYLPQVIQAAGESGFDLVLVETPGIGQGDSALVDLVDISLYVMTPEFGAASQLEKIDMLDFADVVAINKFERRGAEDALRDVSRQLVRNREEFGVDWHDMPVFGTSAARFNDSGVTALYGELRGRLVSIGLPTGSGIVEAVETKTSTRLETVIPNVRNRYLSEVADTVRQYHLRTDAVARLAHRRQVLLEAAAELERGLSAGALGNRSAESGIAGAEHARFGSSATHSAGPHALSQGVDSPKSHTGRPSADSSHVENRADDTPSSGEYRGDDVPSLGENRANGSPRGDSSLEIDSAAEQLSAEKTQGLRKRSGAVPGAAALQELAADVEAEISTADAVLLEQWSETVAELSGRELAVNRGGRQESIPLTKETLSGTHVPRISLPKYTDDGDLLRWLRSENLPGRFPFTAGVFDFKRSGEDPARMFAGEGDPFRTNRRFHLLSQDAAATRLSTAFDSVTLYGRDPASRPDIYGKVGTSGVSIATLDDMKVLYDGFDLVDPTTSVSMTINGPAPAILAMFLNTAIDQQIDKFAAEHDRAPSASELAVLRADTLRAVRGTVQADILKEDQGQNTCLFSTEFSLRCMGDIQQWFIENEIRNFYSVSISGYHIAEAGANPISQLAFTLSNAFTYVEAYLARGMDIDDFAPNLSFFFSNGMDAEYNVLGRVARRIWAVTMRDKYGANERSQKLKYHVQTSGRSLHAQEMSFNDIRTTLQALTALYDNCNSLHTNAYDEAVTTPTPESVRRALAIQMIINHEWGLSSNENPLQGSFVIEELTELVENAVLLEFDRISERGGVLGAMETGYQRGRIQDESLLYEQRKHDGSLPLVGVNMFQAPVGDNQNHDVQLMRATEDEKESQLRRLAGFRTEHQAESASALIRLKEVAESGGNTFAVLMDAVRVCSLGQISEAFFEVGGQYRRNV